MKTIFILLTTFVTGVFTTSNNLNENNQGCNSELSVHKNRSFKSAAEDGASFTLTLTNTSSKTATYFLSTKNLLESCNNKGRSSSEPNVELNVSIIGDSMKRISLDNGITLASGSTYKFVVNVTVPSGTRYNSWSCIEVEASSKECNDSSKMTLSVFVPDPSEG